MPPLGRYGESIADLILRQGDIQARNAMMSGQIWGNAIQNIGQAGAQAYEGYRQQKKADEFAKIVTNPATWDSGNIQSTYARLIPIIGVDGTTQFMNGMAKLADSQHKAQQFGLDEQKAAQAALPGMAEAIHATPLESRETTFGEAWPTLLEKAGIPTEDPWALAESYYQGGLEPQEPLAGAPGTVYRDPNDPTKILAQNPFKPETPEPTLAEEVARARALEQAKAEGKAAGTPQEIVPAGTTAPEVNLLAQGGTLSDIPIGQRAAVTQQAIESGIPVFRDQDQKKGYQNIQAILKDAAELQDLLKDKDVLKYMGPIRGTLTTYATGGGPIEGALTFLGDVPDKVRKAASLMFNLSDRRVRERSGAQVNEKELDRIMRFTVAPHLNPSQIQSNLEQMVREFQTIQEGFAPIGSGGEWKTLPGGVRYRVKR